MLLSNTDLWADVWLGYKNYILEGELSRIIASH